MINLIPPAAKKRVLLEYWVRMVSVWMLVLCVIIIVATLLLLPVYVLVHSKINAHASSAIEAQSKVSEYEISSSALIDASVQASLLLTLEKRQNFSELVTILENTKNPGIEIDSFSFSRTAEGLAPIELTGSADTRQSLADFREDLLAAPEIEKVVLPISNLAQDKDITFTVSVTMKPNHNYMSPRTKKIAILSLVLVFSAAGVFSFMYIQTEKKGELLATYITALEEQEAQQASFIRIRRQVEETVAEREQITKSFFQDESDSIGFLNDTEVFAKSIGLDLKTEGLNKVTKTNPAGEFITMNFVYSGTKSEVLEFTRLLENIPYHSWLDTLQLSELDGVWSGAVTLYISIQTS